MIQDNLFGLEELREQDAPPGVSYRIGLISADEEADLMQTIATLPLERFEFGPYLGNRRVLSFGWRYDYTRKRVEAAPPLPSFLEHNRKRVAAFAGRAPVDFAQAQILAYAPGAGIGWHRDKPQFDIVVGITLASPAVLRFRRRSAGGWMRKALCLERRSGYVLSGEARRNWEHSIVPQTELRYAVTFRSITR